VNPGDDILIRGATVLSMDPDIGDLDRADILVRDGAIAAVRGSIDAPPETAVFDATGMIAIPGFVDTHNHCWNSLLRGLVDQGPELDYFALKRRLGPAFDPQATYAATRLAVAELASSGVTTVHDWAHNVRGPDHARAALRAHRDGGLRARYSYGTPERLPHGEPMDLDDLAALHGEWSDLSGDGRLSLGVALRGPFGGGGKTGSSEAQVRDREVSVARRLGIPLTLHFGADNTRERDGIRGMDVLEREGLLAHDVQLVHVLGTTESERRLSEMRSARGFPPILEHLESGVQVSLSLDSLALSGNADMFATMRLGLMAERVRYLSTEAISPRTVLELATIGGARGLGLQAVTGSLSPGKRADVTLVRTDSLGVSPTADPTHLLVYSAQTSDVDAVLADGRFVKRDGRLVADAATIVLEARAALDEVASKAALALGRIAR
jgi:cytosine/adenosine deaminase-related metal-dependent hydrolase